VSWSMSSTRSSTYRSSISHPSRRRSASTTRSCPSTRPSDSSTATRWRPSRRSPPGKPSSVTS
jgi:hypothetical protein